MKLQPSLAQVQPCEPSPNCPTAVRASGRFASVPARLLVLLVLATVPHSIAGSQELAAQESVAHESGIPHVGRRGFAEDVRSFLADHCIRCHGPKIANAGFRVDQLSPDLATPNAAEQWKEVVDRINLGDMPPEEEPRPAPGEFEPVVDWINSALRDAERSARNAGGRIPMRRLNRVEYANSVRDLLHMDPMVIAPLVEDFPGDGKAEGFDRLGVALFFDQTQIERTLEVAERAIAVGEPEIQTLRAEAEANPRIKPSKKKNNKPFRQDSCRTGAKRGGACRRRCAVRSRLRQSSQV
ncbi:hypothetical protein Poly51_39220 [Rubripirellula tenax]|uniref:Planctomycete cytochrome C n=1 Tax=Rubripirellula tenax TaxID=2528015 RepID=A0A5C6ET39_9BACT|nr:DUF1587 domain-containing protein [Rubripirellula tenax]TWU50629.1 hypothetical protein Poly51_39220 [Rubripirellula tenax]